MKSRFLMAALCAALPVAAGVALAQNNQPPAGFPLAAPAGQISGAADRAPAGALNQGRYNSATWKYGPRNDVPANTPLWNPVMIKLRNNQQVFSATVSGAATPEQYCTQARNTAYDFIWTEMQHSPGSWQNVATMWNACRPVHAVPGARVAVGTEMEIQHATDMGALIVMVPTVDTTAEAAEIAKWTFYPPMGRRSSGGNAASAEYWGGVPGGYRATYNRNMVLVLMIETLEGLDNVDGIAKVPGVTGIFAASGDLGNFTGFAQGDPDYERVINIVHDAAVRANVKLFGPAAWATRPDFKGFQGGPPGAGGGGRGRGARGAAAPAPAQ